MCRSRRSIRADNTEGSARGARWTAGGALLMVLLSGAASGRDLARYGVFVYSDLCVSAQSGDVAGNRISLLRYPYVDHVIYEYTEGALMAPLLADKMTIDPKTGALTFDVSNGDRTVTFHGTMADDALVGTISDRPEPVRLPRVRDFSRKPAECT
jgi:hypothetical protein